MKTRAAALLASGLLLTGALFLTGCDDTQVPAVPGIEEQEDAEDQGEDDEQSED